MWIDYEPAGIPLRDLIDELLPKLLGDGVQPSVLRGAEFSELQNGVSGIAANLLLGIERMGT
jgi:hypothetical protein